MLLRIDKFIAKLIRIACYLCVGKITFLSFDVSIEMKLHARCDWHDEYVLVLMQMSIDAQS